jgi:uncharacterized protein (DUF58 family)
MTWARTPKLGAYTGLTAAALFAALLLRRPELGVVAAPFVLSLALGLMTAVPPRIDATLTLDRDRAVQGEDVQAELRLRSPRTVERLEVRPVLPLGIDLAATGPLLVQLAAGDERVLRLRLHCRRWGGYRIGPIAVRAGDRLGLLAAEDRLDVRRPLTVYPHPELLRTPVRPARTQRLVGDQLARHAGDGVEFAELRPYVAGDQLRQVNWRVSARRGALHVNQQHPDRNADVVLFLDTFTDVGDEQGSSTLDLTVRAAAALAGRYLASRDGVGLVAFGGYLHWLYPAAGRAQAWRMLDVLLQTQAVTSYADKTIQVIPVRMLPPGALILGLTPLLDQRGVDALMDLRGRGFKVVLLVISPVPFIHPGQGEPGEQAFRLWRLQREVVQARYQRLGVPVVEWRPDRPLEAVVEEVRTFQRRVRGRA